MFAKLFVFAACVAVAVCAVADKYPAGLNPALCPNYPDCDNSLIALHSGNPSAVLPYAAAPLYHAGREYPAGVHPAACPNYPYCNTLAFPYAAHYAREYPAGVHPAACPNYPYC
ncbi:cuticle protein 1-like [Ischnura elegans]|uniref:cuticle protein 1-like n=1 Tax=Ischnura elegans TaxID=197161 RepID=UPI001ED868F2|nr:cuticle protein 1-like [Ischnura elegans]